MYKNIDFEPGDVVICSTGYSSWLNISIVIGITAKMVATMDGLKMPSAVCFATDDCSVDNVFKHTADMFKKRFPNTDVKFKARLLK